jgi:hypothetical protein
VNAFSIPVITEIVFTGKFRIPTRQPTHSEEKPFSKQSCGFFPQQSLCDWKHKIQHFFRLIIFRKKHNIISSPFFLPQPVGVKQALNDV